MRRHFDPVNLLKRPIHPLALTAVLVANAIFLFPKLYDPIIQIAFTADIGFGLYSLYYYFHVVRPTAKLLREAAAAPIEQANLIPPSSPYRPRTGTGTSPKPPPNR